MRPPSKKCVHVAAGLCVKCRAVLVVAMSDYGGESRGRGDSNGGGAPRDRSRSRERSDNNGGDRDRAPAPSGDADEGLFAILLLAII